MSPSKTRVPLLTIQSTTELTPGADDDTEVPRLTPATAQEVARALSRWAVNILLSMRRVK